MPPREYKYERNTALGKVKRDRASPSEVNRPVMISARPTRFPIVREVRYKVMNSKGAVEIGTGETINISSRGVLFNAHAPLPPGKRIELSISWPAQLDGRCGLKLVARGRIVHCEGTNVAIEIENHEFRTAGRGLGARAGI